MVACHCKKCGIITKHRPAGEPDRFCCEVCGTERCYAKAAGDFPELTFDENEAIHEARANGFSSFFPAYPDATTQVQNTLRAAKKWMKDFGYLTDH